MQRERTAFDGVDQGPQRVARRGIVGAADPVKAWKRATIERQRAIVRELLDVTVLPSGKRGNGFDPELVKIEWRQS